MRSWTVQELIIETQQQVQRLGSHRREGLEISNIIWRLNTAQDLFVSERIKPDANNPNKFQVDEKYRADIESLITPNVKLPTYYDSATQQFSYLPYNFNYLVNDRSVVLEDCKEQFKQPTEGKTLTVYTLKLGESTLTQAPYYKTINIIYNAGASTVTYNLDGLPSKKEKFELIDYILYKLNVEGAKSSVKFSAYWEQFDTVYSPDSFIVVGEAGIPNIDLQVDGAIAGKTTSNLTVTKLKSFAGDKAVNRGVKHDRVYDLIHTNYYDQPVPDSPVTTMADRKLFVHTSKRFLVTEINIDYIRSPRRISLYLNQTCELPGSTHRQLCGLAAEFILGNIEAANYPAKVQENVLRSE